MRKNKQNHSVCDHSWPPIASHARNRSPSPSGSSLSRSDTSPVQSDRSSRRSIFGVPIPGMLSSTSATPTPSSPNISRIPTPTKTKGDAAKNSKQGGSSPSKASSTSSRARKSPSVVNKSRQTSKSPTKSATNKKDSPESPLKGKRRGSSRTRSRESGVKGDQSGAKSPGPRKTPTGHWPVGSSSQLTPKESRRETFGSRSASPLTGMPSFMMSVSVQVFKNFFATSAVLYRINSLENLSLTSLKSINCRKINKCFSYLSSSRTRFKETFNPRFDHERDRLGGPL